MDIRRATVADVEAVAALHVDSWRRNYRDAYSDEFLDGDVEADRRGVWTERLAQPDPGEYTIVASLDGVVVAFIHVIFDDDSTWGSLIDNLHVAHDLKGNGIGTTLMAAAAEILTARRSANGVYLWVLEQNSTAQAFYTARGGTFVGHEVFVPRGGAGTAVKLRCIWPDVAQLVPLD